ncbi:tumor necrosis factor receptor superfamily member 1A-like [Takifugu rubripes]|uniref:Tumor necrosis factor receptor superfamily, member 1a n=1 Tax=Takifugu rubripes TaxID=31033 RepID=A0A674NLJ2_TAKRU|nr:tumor necrosis factor receptor superfamily member 1A-like [Takifugu rubripes]
MERGAFSRRDTTPLPTVLLLLCLVTPTLTSCLDVEYQSESGICCNKCPPGYRLKEECSAPRERSNCTACPYGQYMDTMNYADKCRTCRKCNNHKVVFRPCKGNQNTVCQCDKGYYRSNIDSENFECLKCRQCDHPEKESQKCTPENNTVCQCEDNYYRLNNKCELCSKCSGECKSNCSVTLSCSKGDESTKGFLYNSIGVATAGLTLLLLVAAVTHVVTKSVTLRRLQEFPSQSSAVTPDPCKEILIPSEESSFDITFKVATITPLSECEQPVKLPDCIPVEIKLSELIYTVLDLVPVLQVKQLVRSLGVRDTEIEQAELDYRPCREAHYQMLRAWAERGSGAGALLHPPLLHDLLNELRKMHLGQAAEELEKVYGFT